MVTLLPGSFISTPQMQEGNKIDLFSTELIINSIFNNAWNAL